MRLAEIGHLPAARLVVLRKGTRAIDQMVAALDLQVRVRAEERRAGLERRRPVVLVVLRAFRRVVERACADNCLRVAQAARGVLPFLIAELAVLVALVLFPAIVMVPAQWWR